MRRADHIVIVGCGFTGTTALCQLVERYPVRRVTVFESSGEFGPGFPYQVGESREYLINNTNDTMCLLPENRRAFLEWLERHPTYSRGLDASGHMPRAVYGEFLREAVSRATDMARQKGIDVRFVERECTDIEEPAEGPTIVHWDGGSTEANIVILATGRCPDRDVFELAGRKGYFPTHMPGSKLSSLPTDAEVHVIGASLSAYDVVNELFGEESGCEFVDSGSNRLQFVAGGNDRKVVVCSRSGRLKKVQGRFPFPVERRHFNAEAIRSFPERGVTLSALWDLAAADAAGNGVELDRQTLFEPYADCSSVDELNARAAELLAADIDAAANETPANFVVDYLEDAKFDIWDLFATHKLTESEEVRYRSDVESALLACAAPCPVPTGQKILALMEAGRLRILHGVSGVSAHEESFAVDHAFGSECAAYVVNATGAVDRDVHSDRQPHLIRRLVRRGLLRPYVLNGEPAPGAAIDMRTFRCEGSKRIHAANMLLWGPGFFTSSAIVMATVVDRMLRSAFDERER